MLPCNRIFRHLNLNSECVLEDYNKSFFIQIESYDIIYTSASLWTCIFAIRSFKDEIVLRKAFLSSSQDSGSCSWGDRSLSPYGNSVRDSTCMPSWWTALSKPYNKNKKKSVMPVVTRYNNNNNNCNLISYVLENWYF